jgi:CubicO group peptidase (beta-lactamase class C family)
VVRNGYLIWRGPGCDEVIAIASAGKSFTSTCLGLLIDDGKCTLKTRAKDHVPGLAAHYSTVTLRHFATMTSGYGADAAGSELTGRPWKPLVPGPPLFAPGTKYRYSDDAMMQFGNALTRVAGEPLDRLFKRRVADPIGMKRWTWDTMPSPEGPILLWDGGIRTSARELARFGHLFLNRGNWTGKQLVSAAWVGQATAVQVPASVPNDAEPRSRGAGVYGYNWWVNGVKPDGKRWWPDAPPRAYYASGIHANVCIVVPEWNLVIARTNGPGKGGGRNSPPNLDEVWNNFLGKLAKALPPAVAQH